MTYEVSRSPPLFPSCCLGHGYASWSTSKHTESQIIPLRPGRHQVQEPGIHDGRAVAIVSINSQLLGFFCERNQFLFSLRWDYFHVIFVMIVTCWHRLLFNYLPLIIYFKFLYFTCTSYLRFSKTYSQSVVGTQNELSCIFILRKNFF